MTQPRLIWKGTGLSHQGRVRASNQDALAIDNERGLWVVADGMGGYTGGQVASELAVSAIVNHFRDTLTTSFAGKDQLSQPSGILTQAVAAAKTAIEARIAEEPDLQNMGTTVVAALFVPDLKPSMTIAHVGDSRAYRIRGTQLEPITTDHSLVQQLVTEGHLTLEQAQDHPKKNVIVRALGLNFPSIADVAGHPLEPEDIILLCTDGLTKMLSDKDILTVILEYIKSPQEVCQRLIDRANSAGGLDNITVLLITPQVA